MTTVYHGQADVARWCGTASASVVSNWIRRHPDTAPEPDVIIRNDSLRGAPTRGWLPERRAEWEAFAAARKHALPPGSAAAVRARKKRKAAGMIYADMQAGTIDATTAARLLHDLI